MFEAIFSASCGVPPLVSTSTALLNVTVASITSSRANVSPTIGEASATPVTPGGPELPSTLVPGLVA